MAGTWLIVTALGILVALPLLVFSEIIATRSHRAIGVWFLGVIVFLTLAFAFTLGLALSS
jgi:predicted permease